LSEYTTPKDDDQLMARLRKGLGESDAAPADVTSFAKAAFTWRDIDAELAELEFDSVDEEVPSGVRSTGTARMVSFQAGQWILDVEYDETTGRLMGHIAPSARYTIELHTAGTFFTTSSDESGRFHADGVIPGPLSLVLRFEDGQVIKTQWIVL